MKKAALFVSALAALCAVAQNADPTVASDTMADALRRSLAGGDALRLNALVVGASGDGIALVGPDAAGSTVVRRGSTLAQAAEGVRVDVAIKSVTERGVEIAGKSPEGGLFLPGSFLPLDPPESAPPEFIRYIESQSVPIGLLSRLVADQTGANVSVSDAASRKPVSIFLRNVTAEAAVEEICRATGLWFRRESGGRIIRVMTMAEYAESLNTFREESTEMFTLLYPNVIEVASVIYGLHPDRTYLSLGEEEFDEDDEYDLSRRFRRFRVIEDNGGSQFMDMAAPRSSGGASRSGSGTFSFSRGGVTSNIEQWDQMRRRSRQFDAALAADDANRLEQAERAGDTNLVQVVRSALAPSSANIFVTLSRRNNMLVVRTSDVKVMDEIRSLVKRLDVPTPMVLMELKVLELSIDDDYEASFSYSFNRGTHTIGQKQSAGGANIFSDIVQPIRANVDPTFAFKVVADNIEAQIALMQKDGKVRTLATPTLLVANNEVARIFSGKEYPLVTGWTPGTATTSPVSGTVTTPSVPILEKKDIGTMLLITPNINADKTVTLRLLQENSDLSADTASIPVIDSTGAQLQDKEVQYVESRTLAGTFVAKDGMTIMAGGLVKETEGETYWRTPVLGSIPLVGWLFRGTEKTKRRTELVVLVKPHVILTPMEGGRISKELMKAISAHPAADGRANMGVHKPDAPHTVGDDVNNVVK